MFRLLPVLIEYGVLELDRPFTYALNGDEECHKGYRVLVVFNRRPSIGFVLEEPQAVEGTLEEYNAEQKTRILPVESVLDKEPILNEELLELSKEASAYYLCPRIEMLKAMLPPSLRPNSVSLSKPKQVFKDYYVLRDADLSSFELDAHEKKLIEKFRQSGGRLKKSEITSKISLEKLLFKKIAVPEKDEVYRRPDVEASFQGVEELNPAQKAAYESILKTDKQVTLLEGVTGSGKTEIYIRLVQHELEQGRGSIVLVPEISLTDRLISRFKGIFGDRVALLHSGLSDSQKYDEYRRIASKKATIVVGARSAVFAPVDRLGLIVIDEEHSESYKQDVKPFYDARTIAQFRLKQDPSRKLVLGSATPSLEHRARAERGLFHFVRIDQRYNDVLLPDVSVVDLSDFSNIDYRSALLSLPLRAKLQETLGAQKQAILLLNRRGYSPVYICRKCQKVVSCPNCSVPLTYHKKEHALICHHCGYEVPADEFVCPHCSGREFTYNGFGTERIIEELQEFFPDARIVRFDADETRSKGKYHKILTDFSNGKYDIMVGTQMVAKGHDFPSVSFACALLADTSLEFPSYKAAEDTFDLLTQLVGRAGRREKGSAMIQTYSKDNPVLNYATKQDYDGFYAYEMQNRKERKYPPYVYLLKISVSASSSENAELAGRKIKGFLVAKILKDRLRAELLGPTVPYIEKVGLRYYRTLLLKYKDRSLVEKPLQELKGLDYGSKDIRLSLDVDPSSDA